MATTTKKTALGKLPTVRKKTRKLTPAQKKYVAEFTSMAGTLKEFAKKNHHIKYPD